MIKKLYIPEYDDREADLYDTQEKVNELVDAVNNLENHTHYLLEQEAIRIAKTLHKPETPPEEKGTPDTILVEDFYGYNKAKVPEHYKLRVQKEAIAAYKKRLVERMNRTLTDSKNDIQTGYNYGIEAAITTVETTE